MEQTIGIIRRIICVPIRLYQYLIRPLMRPCCRFYPSCSEYALIAVTNHGVCKGLWLTTLRLLRCHPWANGGYDPVLPTDEKL
jgi:hypothetical protein